MREGVPGVEMARAMEGMTREMLPFAVPFINYLHGRLLAYFVEQDVIGHMEAELDGEEPAEEGRMRVAIAFADLAGYTRLTEERGDRGRRRGRALRGAVEQTLPIDARVIKTLGDEVMVVGADPGALTGWAVGLQRELADRRAAPAHRDPLAARRSTATATTTGARSTSAARVVARAAGGEVLVTRPVVEAPAASTACVRADRRGRSEGLRRADRDLPASAPGR